MTYPRAVRHRGFLFIEIIAVLGMIAAVALASTQLYVQMTRSHARLQKQREAQQRFDLALRPLRSDAWSATAASVDEGGILHLVRPDGKTIAWQAGDRLRRNVDDGPSRDWNSFGVKLSFVIRDGGVVLREEPSQAADNGGDITLPLVSEGLKRKAR